MQRLVIVLFGIAVSAGVTVGGDAPVRTAAILALDADRGVRELASIPGYPIINSPEISNDGEWVAVDGWQADQDLRDARVLVVNVESAEVRDLGPGAMPTFSPGGHRLVISRYGNGGEGGVWVLNMDGADAVFVKPDGWSGRWSPDGRQIAWTTSHNGNAAIEVMDIIEGIRHTVFEGDEATRYARVYWNFCWSPDSKAICFKGRLQNGGDEVAIVDVRGSRRGFKVRLSGATAAQFNPDIAWHPGGSRIAMPKKSQAGEPGQIYEFDPSRDDEPTRLEGQPANRHNGGMCWSPDGRTLVFLSRG